MNSPRPGALGAVGVVLLAAGLVAGPSVLPSIRRTATTTTQNVPVTPTTPALICPGPETLLVPEGGEPVDPEAAVLVTALVGSPGGAATAELTVRGEPADAAEAALPFTPTSSSVPVTWGDTLTLTADSADPALGTLNLRALGPALLKPVPAVDSDPAPALAAVQSTLARSGDRRSLTTTTCTSARSEGWLVGGSTMDGARLRLLLANPATSAAVVDVDVRGPEGKVQAASGEGVVVPAGGEVPIFVDALAPELERVAVHVTTRSGRVRATLHDSRMIGLDPGGADDVPVAAKPAKRQVVPGISLVNGYSRTAADPLAPGSTAVRVVVPGTEEAVVRVQLLDSSGAVELPQAAVVNVPAGTVVDLPVSGIPSGTYTAVVDADVPIVAGALIGRSAVAGTDPATEIAWAASAPPLTGSGYLALPPAVRSTMSLVAAGKAGRATVSEVHSDGSIGRPVNVDMPAGTSATVQFGAEAVAVRIGGISAGPVAASVVSWIPDPRGSLISVISVNLPKVSTPPGSAVHHRTLGLP